MNNDFNFNSADLQEINGRWRDINNSNCENYKAIAQSLTILEYIEFAKFFIIGGMNSEDNSSINGMVEAYFDEHHDSYDAPALSSLLRNEAEHFFQYGKKRRCLKPMSEASDDIMLLLYNLRLFSDIDVPYEVYIMRYGIIVIDGNIYYRDSCDPTRLNIALKPETSLSTRSRIVDAVIEGDNVIKNRYGKEYIRH